MYSAQEIIDEAGCLLTIFTMSINYYGQYYSPRDINLILGDLYACVSYCQ
jgi:hypothetical protein